MPLLGTAAGAATMIQAQAATTAASARPSRTERLASGLTIQEVQAIDKGLKDDRGCGGVDVDLRRPRTTPIAAPAATGVLGLTAREALVVHEYRPAQGVARLTGKRPRALGLGAL